MSQIEKCFYCDAPGTTRDHLLPRSRGGSDDPVNLVACCQSCNSSKGNRTPGEFIASRSGCRIDSIMSHPSHRTLLARVADLAGIPRGWDGRKGREALALQMGLGGR